MGFLKVFFGSGNMKTESVLRLPESSSCTTVNSADTQDTCASFDFSFCGRKPWSSGVCRQVAISLWLSFQHKPGI